MPRRRLPLSIHRSFDCADAVVVRGYDSGATLKVYVAGVLRGTKAGATSYSQWVDLTVPLAGDQAVEATQTVAGVESAHSTAAIVAAPDPASPIHLMPPVEACAQAGYVYNADTCQVRAPVRSTLHRRSGSPG